MMRLVRFLSCGLVLSAASNPSPWRDPADPAPCKKHRGHNDPRTTFAPTCKKTPVPFKLCRGTKKKKPIKFYNNLAGKGPDTDQPEAFRMFKIAKVEGQNLDLVVKVGKRSTYSSWSQ